MKRALSVLLLPISLAACGTAAASNGSASTSPSAASSNSAVLSVGSTGLGQILVDGNGKTLYLFEADSASKSTCSGACAQVWPPLTTVGTPKASGAAMQSLIATMKRSDCSLQVTYAGHPLYYFISDAKPGDTNGEG